MTQGTVLLIKIRPQGLPGAGNGESATDRPRSPPRCPERGPAGPRTADPAAAPVVASNSHRDAGALSATDGLRDRPQLRLRAEVVVVVEPDKLPSPKEVGSSSSHPPSPRRPAHARRLSLAQRELALSLAQREICAATRTGNL